MADDERKSLARPILLLVAAAIVVTGGLFLGLRGARTSGGDADAASAAGGTEAAVVRMTDQLTFAPAAVRIEVGQAVRWTNPSKVVHTATSRSVPEGAASFDSGDVAPGGSYSHTFEVAGTYSYYCIPHEGAGMVGTVIVGGE